MAVGKREYLASIERDGRRIVSIAGRDLDRVVPTCPAWTVTNVLGHLGRVHRSVTMQVAKRALEMLPFEKVALPPGAELVAWFDESLEGLLSALRDVEPDEPLWSWGGSTAMFYFRRMAHETATHRFDVESAMDDITPIDSDMATDGVAELYEVVLPSRLARGKIELPAGSLHLHRSDGDGEWMLQAVDGRVSVTHEHGKGDAAVRGPAPDLFLFVWNRGQSSSLQVFGDESLARAWAALAP